MAQDHQEAQAWRTVLERSSGTSRSAASGSHRTAVLEGRGYCPSTLSVQKAPASGGEDMVGGGERCVRRGQHLSRFQVGDHVFSGPVHGR